MIVGWRMSGERGLEGFAWGEGSQVLGSRVVHERSWNGEETEGDNGRREDL